MKTKTKKLKAKVEKKSKKLTKKNKRLAKAMTKKKPQAKIAKKVKKKPKPYAVGVGIVPRKKPIAAYFGMDNVPHNREDAVDGLIRVLRDLDKLGPTTEVAIYGSYHRVRAGGMTADIWTIGEVSYFTPTGPRRESDGLRPGHGTCYQRCIPEALGFIAACEDFLGHYFTTPIPVIGGESIDERADAEARLRYIHGMGKLKEPDAPLPPPVVETNFLPLDYEEAKAAYDWLTSDGEEQADGEMTLNHLTPEEQALVVKLKTFIAKCEESPSEPEAEQPVPTPAPVVEGEGLTAEG